MTDTATPSQDERDRLQVLRSAVQEPKGLLVQWRRAQVIAYLGMGMNQQEIAKNLGVNPSTISRDCRFLQEEAKTKNAKYIDDLAFQHQLALEGLNQILRHAWRLFVNNDGNTRSQLGALLLIKEVIMTKQELLGDPEQIERAISTVSVLRNRIGKQDERKEASTA